MEQADRGTTRVQALKQQVASFRDELKQMEDAVQLILDRRDFLEKQVGNILDASVSVWNVYFVLNIIWRNIKSGNYIKSHSELLDGVAKSGIIQRNFTEISESVRLWKGKLAEILFLLRFYALRFVKHLKSFKVLLFYSVKKSQD